MVFPVAKTLINGLLCGVLGVVAGLLPIGAAIEEELGLDRLFKFRGERKPPPEVVVISIDGDSGRALGLPRKPERWRRDIHAGLVERLTAAGAVAGGFDVYFAEAREAAEDRRFAEAIAAAGNVVLLQWLVRETEDLPVSSAGAGEVVVSDKLLSPISPLARAAVGLAPFPLPKVPAKVKQAWLFKAVLFKAGSGDMPTLPAVMLQLYAMDYYEDLLPLIRDADPEFAASLPGSSDEAVRQGQLQDLVRIFRMRFRFDQSLAARLLARLELQPSNADPRAQRILRAIVSMYGGRDDPYLNFYGPPRTITTLPYHEAVSASPEGMSRAVRGKAVFVGISEDAQPRQRDGFYTPFTSDTTGLDISGVEIAATTFANLLEADPVRQLGTGVLLGIIFMCGMIAGVVARLFVTPVALGGTLALGAGYVLWAYLGFSRSGIWYPFAIPLLLQIPTALLTAFVWRYVDSNREQRKIKKAFEHYLPPAEVEKVAKDISSITGGNREMYGTCLYTDVEKFTSLSERVAPAELGALMNRYFETMIRPVREHGGMVSNLAGDAMLATWASDAAESGDKQLACEAALAIREAVDQLNRTLGEYKLPTRIGLHAGRLLLGNIGAMDHYEYSVLGDMVNTAARIQAVNKVFGTRILVSGRVTNGVNGLVTRELGCFLLVGKHTPVSVHELVAKDDAVGTGTVERIAVFENALVAYRGRDWDAARHMFQELAHGEPGDLASRLYVEECERLLEYPPGPDWNGVIALTAK